MVEEQELGRRVINGDAEAREVFFRLYSPQLLRTSMYFLGTNDAEAEEVVKESLLIAMHRLKHYDFSEPLFVLLRQICLRLCYLRMRGVSGSQEAVQENRQRIAAEFVEAEEMGLATARPRFNLTGATVDQAYG